MKFLQLHKNFFLILHQVARWQLFVWTIFELNFFSFWTSNRIFMTSRNCGEIQLLLCNVDNEFWNSIVKLNVFEISWLEFFQGRLHQQFSFSSKILWESFFCIDQPFLIFFDKLSKTNGSVPSINVSTGTYLFGQDYNNKTVSNFSSCWNLDTQRSPTSADSIDLSRPSKSYFFNNTGFAPPGKVTNNIFLTGGGFFQNIINFLIFKPDRPNLTYFLIKISDIGFETHNSPKRPAFFLALRVQSTALHLMKSFLRKLIDSIPSFGILIMQKLQKNHWIWHVSIFKFFFFQ